MSDVVVEPYLFFQGDCKQAMEFYQSIFGGELTIQTMDEMPAGSPAIPGSQPSDVMYAALTGGAMRIMASDTAEASPQAAKVELCVSGSDEDKMHAIFEALSDDGVVRSPLKKEFWGDTFGSLRDKYGVDWMMSITSDAS